MEKLLAKAAPAVIDAFVESGMNYDIEVVAKLADHARSLKGRGKAVMSPEEIDAVLGHLKNGCAHRGACERAGVSVNEFRAARRSDSTLQLRTDRARAAGLRQVATWLREKAAKNEALAHKLAPTFEDWVLL